MAGLTFGPLTVFLIVVLVALLITIIRMAADPEPLHQPLRIIVVVGCVLALGGGGWQEYRHQRTQVELTAHLQTMTGFDDARVKCQRIGESFFSTVAHMGHVMHGSHTVNLKKSVCNTLSSTMNVSDGDAGLSEMKQASHLFTHEAVHVMGEFNEAATECYAIQHDNSVWALLTGQHDDVGEWYYENHYPNMPSEYRSSGCTQGGALDLGIYTFYDYPLPLWIGEGESEKDEAESAEG